jgi:hypothetical protein
LDGLTILVVGPVVWRLLGRIVKLLQDTSAIAHEIARGDGHHGHRSRAACTPVAQSGGHFGAALMADWTVPKLTGARIRYLAGPGTATLECAALAGVVPLDENTRIAVILLKSPAIRNRSMGGAFGKSRSISRRPAKTLSARCCVDR